MVITSCPGFDFQQLLLLCYSPFMIFENDYNYLTLTLQFLDHLVAVSIASTMEPAMKTRKHVNVLLLIKGPIVKMLPVSFNRD